MIVIGSFKFSKNDFSLSTQLLDHLNSTPVLHRFHPSVTEQMTGKHSKRKNWCGRGSSRPSLSAPLFVNDHPAHLPTSQDYEPSSSTSIAASSTDKEARPELHVEGNSILPSHHTTAILRSIFSSLIEHDGTSWMKVSDGTKKLYHREFHKRCKWDPAYNDSIEALYSEKAASCYRDMIQDWLDNWHYNHKKPVCLSNDTWNDFLDYLNDVEGGSRSAWEHAEDIKAQEKTVIRSHPTEASTEPQPVQKDCVFGVNNITNKRSYSNASCSSIGTPTFNELDIYRLFDENFKLKLRVIYEVEIPKMVEAATKAKEVEMIAKIQHYVNMMCGTKANDADVEAIRQAIVDDHFDDL